MCTSIFTPRLCRHVCFHVSLYTSSSARSHTRVHNASFAASHDKECLQFIQVCFMLVCQRGPLISCLDDLVSLIFQQQSSPRAALHPISRLWYIFWSSPARKGGLGCHGSSRLFVPAPFERWGLNKLCSLLMQGMWRRRRRPRKRRAARRSEIRGDSSQHARGRVVFSAQHLHLQFREQELATSKLLQLKLCAFQL